MRPMLDPSLSGLTCDFSALGGPGNGHHVGRTVRSERNLQLHGGVAGDAGGTAALRHGHRSRNRSA